MVCYLYKPLSLYRIPMIRILYILLSVLCFDCVAQHNDSLYRLKKLYESGLTENNFEELKHTLQNITDSDLENEAQKSKVKSDIKRI